MSAGSLHEQVVEMTARHADDGCGDCICSEYVLSVPFAAHLADTVLAVVREWLASESAREVVIDALVEPYDYGSHESKAEYRRTQARWESGEIVNALAALIDQTKED